VLQRIIGWQPWHLRSLQTGFKSRAMCTKYYRKRHFTQLKTLSHFFYCAILRVLIFQHTEEQCRMAVKKKATAKKKATVKAVKKPTTKSETLAFIAEKTDLAKKDVGAVFEQLAVLMKRDLKRGPGVYTVPGLMKVKVVRKPATRARKGVNPFTGEEMMFKAKPARNIVKVLPLKGLKDMV
jgi:nucleoid DNA-binding protein